ncbi:hypothetical protein HK101_010054 [Irineochytrium annulatum]|nr:hypothetical protein HK101_010054 [Irineochytrium annulatum]
MVITRSVTIPGQSTSDAPVSTSPKIFTTALTTTGTSGNSTADYASSNSSSAGVTRILAIVGGITALFVLMGCGTYFYTRVRRDRRNGSETVFIKPSSSTLARREMASHRQSMQSSTNPLVPSDSSSTNRMSYHDAGGSSVAGAGSYPHHYNYDYSQDYQQPAHFQQQGGYGTAGYDAAQGYEYGYQQGHEGAQYNHLAQGQGPHEQLHEGPHEGAAYDAHHAQEQYGQEGQEVHRVEGPGPHGYYNY